jgi:GAF domain-containing protein
LTGADGYPHRSIRPWADQPLAYDCAARQPDTFAAALAQLGSTIRREGAVDDQHALAAIMEAAVAMIAGAQQAAVVVPARSRQLKAKAMYGELPPLVIRLQNIAGEGPCLDAVEATSQVLVTDLGTDARWPRFAAEATPLGVRSMLCTPLAVQGTVLGSLSLASAEPDAFDDESMALAAVFAAHATLALLGVLQVRDLAAMADTRDLIGQAKGIVMERYKLSSDAAFQLLVATSQHTNIKLRQVCQRLADTGELPELTTPLRNKRR